MRLLRRRARRAVIPAECPVRHPTPDQGIVHCRLAAGHPGPHRWVNPFDGKVLEWDSN